MDKLTREQEVIVRKLLHYSKSEEFSQFILKTIEEHNCVHFLVCKFLLFSIHFVLLLILFAILESSFSNILTFCSTFFPPL